MLKSARTIDIKITSPAKGQEIPVGIKNLPISGTSTYNSTMSCQVSLIVDDVKPYQKAVAAHGADYSSWNYTLTPHYTNIKQGPNKLTAKLSCHDNSMNATKFYSVNITGRTSSSKQSAVNTSKSTVANQTKNETGKATPLPAKQNVTTASTALQPTGQLPSTLTVNGMLAKTGILSLGPSNRQRHSPIQIRRRRNLKNIIVILPQRQLEKLVSLPPFLLKRILRIVI